MNYSVLLIFLALCALWWAPAAGQETETEAPNNSSARRNAKLFSVFQVIRFQNTACTGTSSKNGTCYTSSECTAKGGSSGGSCASGYGVCCVFSLKCGGSSSQNCTYFESTGTEVGQCRINICKCNSNICQIRLDFNTFVITGPSTSTTSFTKMIRGQTAQLSAGQGVAVSPTTACLTDTFSVTNPGGIAPPVICGTNTGYHMYVDASDTCNTMAFELGASAYTGSSIPNRQWSIKITQYGCDYNNLAPEGCTQYYFGSQTNCVYSYNYAGGVQLGSQNQNICVRKEREYCRICWSTTTPTDFQVSGAIAAMGYNQPSRCCGYGPAAIAAMTLSFDCLTIPGAEKTNGVMMVNERFCGRSVGLVTWAAAAAASTTALTVCSNRQPFSIRFLSDTYDMTTEAIGTTLLVPKGFKLCYNENTSNC